MPLLLRLLRGLSWPALRAQWGRQGLAWLAIALGVALAWGVHLVNASALAEFDAAARAVGGRPDLQLRPASGTIAEAALARLHEDPAVLLAAPVISAELQLQRADGRWLPLQLLGVDLLAATQLMPDLMPELMPASPAGDAPGLQRLTAPDALHLNAAALKALGPAPGPAASVVLRWSQQGQTRQASLRLAGRLRAPGQALAVMDVAAAQALLGRQGSLDRIDVRLQPGIAAQRWADALGPAWRAGAPGQEAGLDLGELSRAYRVNLGVLSLMALFTGSFLVFAVQSLGVAQRLPQLALLGVLGLAAGQRRALLLAEGLILGASASLLGLLLGTGLAALGLRLLGGDLGSGLLAGAAPPLHLQPWALALHGLLGTAVALAASWLPAQRVARMPVAQVLKGLGTAQAGQAWRLTAWLAPLLWLLAALLLLLPAWQGLPLAAYLAMLLMLLGGLLAVPTLLRALVALLQHRAQRGALTLLLLRRAQDQAGEALQLMAGVLVALALSVAMLVMVSSFRDSLVDWLRQVLPADLYLRASLREADGQSAPLPARLLDAARQDAAIVSQRGQRQLQAWAGADQRISLLARPLGDARQLPLLGPLAPQSDAPPGAAVAVYINEALSERAGLQPGQPLPLRLDSGATLTAWVRGVWRDYSRQSGALLIEQRDYQRWSGDTAISELHLWLAPGADMAALQQRLGGAAEAAGLPIEFAASGELLALSLRIFDRSFAISYWLQALALGLSLVGVAASLSAQLLARRRELGLLRHLGLARAQLLRLLLAETALYAGVGVAAGLGLGLLLSAVLVHVVNPQSFHWSMSLALPTARLAQLAGAVLLAALVTAAWVGRRAGAADAVQAVRSDW